MTVGVIDEVRRARARAGLRALSVSRPDLFGRSEDEWFDVLKRHEEDAMSGEAPMTFRAPPDLVERLDRHAERLSRERPGFTVTRSDVIRSLLIQGLDEAEASGAGRPRRPRAARSEESRPVVEAKAGDAPKLMRAWREQNGHTLRSAADLLGVNFRTLNDYERGKGAPRRDGARRIEAVTGVPVDAWK